MLKFVTTNVASNERKLLSELSDRMRYEYDYLQAIYCLPHSMPVALLSIPT